MASMAGAFAQLELDAPKDGQRGHPLLMHARHDDAQRVSIGSQITAEDSHGESTPDANNDKTSFGSEQVSAKP